MAPLRTSRRESFWDLAYSDGEHLEHWEPLEVPSELIAALEQGLVAPGQTALDLGCGAGAEAVFLAGRGISVLGVDSSPVALELAQRRAEGAGVSVDWRQGDVVRLPVPDRAIDFAYDRGCLHVIPRRRRKRYAREVARVLRLGGSLLLRGAREDDDDLGLIGISRREIDRLFAPRGLDCVSFTPLVMRARSGTLEAVTAVLTLAR